MGDFSVKEPVKPLKRLYTVSEAATYLGRPSVWAVRRLIENGHLPSIRVGRRIHIDLRDMETLIERNKISESNA
jgi:excisionase family DNA binding protein